MKRTMIGSLLTLFMACGCSSEHSKNEVPVDFSSLETQNYFSILVESHKTHSQSVNFSSDTYTKALRVLSLKLVGRDPSLDELKRVSQGREQYEKIVKEYLKSDEFINQMRKYFHGVFEMSGQSGGINYEEPTNLALFLVKNNLNFKQILTSTLCYNNQLKPVSCDSFKSPSEAQNFASGVLTSRAFLQKWNASFNFRRVAKAFHVFACSEYPDSTDPGLEPEKISERVKSFRCTDCVPACYSCHKSMNPRAALFYSFDRNGMFNTSPNANESTQTDTGAPSTVRDVLVDGAKPLYHGQPMNQLKDYGSLLSESRKFKDCMAQRFSSFLLGTSGMEKIPAEFQDVRDRLSWNGFQMKSFLYEMATHPSFIKRSN